MKRIHLLLLFLVACLFLLFLSLGLIGGIEFTTPAVTSEQTYSLLKTIGLGFALAATAGAMAWLYSRLEPQKKDNNQ